MFIEENCTLCGLCLAECPFLELPLDDAQEEIARLIRTGESGELSGDCAGCSYCDVICPTEANPSELRREILNAKTRSKGASCLSLMTDDVPCNIMSIGLELGDARRRQKLDTYLDPAHGEQVFYLGCSLSHIFADLVETRLLEGLPKVGGMSFCCGGYVYRLFGVREARIKGKQLLEALREAGIRQMITFCPGCDEMMRGVYPTLIPEFDIEVISFAEHLLDRHRRGEIEFTNPIERTVTVHDSCAWRRLAPELYEHPRRLLQLIGAEIVEMQHNRRESMCCGRPLSGRNPALASAIAEERVGEAKQTGAEAIVVSCTGCFALSEAAEAQGLEVYNITELAQLAIGEEPPHRIGETDRQLRAKVVEKIRERPELLSKRYVIRDGRIGDA